MDVADIIKNPVKSKLLLEISRCKQTTAKHLAETFTDIPPATLYRYLKKMTSDGVLEVVRQTQIRGTTEKTYALAAGLRQELEDMSTSGESYLLAFTQYMLGFHPGYNGFTIDPCIPADWKQVTMTRKFRGDTYQLTIKNQSGAQRGVKELWLDGEQTDTNAVLLFGDGKTHTIEVIM